MSILVSFVSCPREVQEAHVAMPASLSDLFEKTVFNILGNSLKYTLEGSISVFVRYRTSCVEIGFQDVSSVVHSAVSSSVE